MITHQIDLNLVPTGVLPRINVSQYDYGESVECTLWNGDVLYTIPTGVSAKVSGTKKDNTGFEYNCTIANNKITFTIRQQMTAFEGEVATELTLYNNANRLSTINFILNVEKSALQDDVVISETDIPIIQEIPELVAECEDYADKAHKWATYGSDSEQPSATNNAKYWAQQSQQSFQKTDVYRVMGYNGAKNLIDATKNWTSIKSTVTVTDTSINVKTTTAQTWSQAYQAFKITPNTNYTFTTDATYISGDGYIEIYSSPNGSTVGTVLARTDFTSSQSISLSVNADSNPYIVICLCCTKGTAMTGEVTYNNVMLRLAEDTDTTYQPYAMTNKELTSGLAPLLGKIALSTCRIGSSGWDYSDCNDLPVNSFAYGYAGEANKPSASGDQYQYLTLASVTNDYLVQIAFRTNNTNLVFTRRKLGTTWSAWTELAPKIVESETYSVATYGGTIYADKFGKVVTITATGIGATQSFSSTSGQLIYTLPQIYQPTTNRVVTGIGTISNNLGSADMQVLIASDGSLYVKGTNISTGRFSVTYVTNK